MDPGAEPSPPDWRHEVLPAPSGAAVAQDAAVVLGAFVLLGAIAGLIWSILVEPTQLTRYEQGIGQGQLELSGIFAADGWYVVVALACGLAGGFGLGLRRARDPLVAVLLVTIGALAAALVMRDVGPLLGPADPTEFLQAAPVGTTADAPFKLSSTVALLAWPVAGLTGILIVLLSRTDEASDARPDRRT